MPEDQIGLLERDPREVSLPGWAQDLLSRYRLALTVIGAVHRHIIRPEGAVITISSVEPGMEPGSFVGEVKAEPFYSDPADEDLPTEEDLKTLAAWHKHTIKRDDPWFLPLGHQFENSYQQNPPKLIERGYTERRPVPGVVSANERHEEREAERRIAEMIASEDERLEAPEPFPHYNEHDDSAYQVGKDRDDR